ncbi:MAG: hypothetical protein AABM67_04800 [Acidobacteriota bacterium]
MGNFTLTLAVSAAVLMLSSSVLAQNESQLKSDSSLCSRESAIELIEQQIEGTRTVKDSVQRIRVLIRASDLLWPHNQRKARSAFSEAFELATQYFKERGDNPTVEGRGMLVETPDQRYVVIRAVARRDPAWAKRLTEELLNKERQEAESGAKDSQTDIRTAEKLLDSASSLLSSDLNAATSFATASLRYPASMRLTMFLYKFAEVNQQEADHFYAQAFAAYAAKPMREFLYLAAYPFGLNETGDMPWMGPYSVPPAFVLNSSLQRMFVQTLLRRAQMALQVPLDEGDNYNGLPGTGHILEVLVRLEPQVLKLLPDLSATVEQARNDLLATLSPENQATFLKPTSNQDAAAGKSLKEQVEAAEKVPNVNKRDELLSTAILNAGPEERLEDLLSTADKIADTKLRSQLLDWVYFNRAQEAVKSKLLDEAMRLAANVKEMDQRAYLYSEIARQAFQKIENEQQARDLLEDIITTASKGPNTLVTARSLLAAAYLYLKIDPARAIPVFAEAVKAINRIESPDFSRTYVMRRIEGRNFARYASFRTPGFDPENVFREMAKINFDDALSQVNGLTDKSLRSLTTLVLAEFCLQRVEEQERIEKAKKKVKSP